MEKYLFLKFKSLVLPNSMLKTIKGGYGSASGPCSASAKCNDNKTIECSGTNSCSGTDYDRVICDGKITNCPECH